MSRKAFQSLFLFFGRVRSRKTESKAEKNLNLIPSKHLKPVHLGRQIVEPVLGSQV